MATLKTWYAAATLSHWRKKDYVLVLKLHSKCYQPWNGFNVLFPIPNTGRDSVIANNRTSSSVHEGQDGIAKEDYALVLKLYKALKGIDDYDYTNLRSVCLDIDDSGHGVIPRKKVCQGEEDRRFCFVWGKKKTLY